MLIKRSERFAQNNTKCMDLSFSDKNGSYFPKSLAQEDYEWFLWRRNTQIAVISRKQHHFGCFSGKQTNWGFTRRIGMFIVRVIPEVWPSG
ncbi:hypothetical protein C1192_07370 [Escherichia marmotae]|nr:hypothetical protein C1192_07370 [Escherichia marmotae]